MPTNEDIEQSAENPVTQQELPNVVLKFVAELAIVFLGVLGAFFADDLRQSAAETDRRNQILTALRGDLREANADAPELLENLDAMFNPFAEAYVNGETPPLELFELRKGTRTRSLWNALISGDGSSVLPVELVVEIEAFYRTQDWANNEARRFIDLLHSELIPQLGAPIETFYEPVSGKLRPRFAWYPRSIEILYGAQRALIEDRRELIAELDRVLDR